MKRGTPVALLVIAVIGSGLAISCKKKSDSPDPAAAAAASVKPQIDELVQLAKQIRASDPAPPLADPALLRGSSDSVQAKFARATLYNTDGDYEHAIEIYNQLVKAPTTDGKIAGHYGLGNAYYDLALLDMMNRRLFTQTRMGVIQPKPDDRAKRLLTAAKTEFSHSIVLAGSVPPQSQERIQQLDRYLAGTPTDMAVATDQAKCGTWLIGLARQRPELIEISRRTVNTFRWQMFLQQDRAVSPTPAMLAARKARLQEIDRVCGEYGYQVKGMYCLATTTAFWQMWYMHFAVAKEKGSRFDPQAVEGLKSVGKEVAEGADLLGVSLPADVQALLLKLEGGQEAFLRTLKALEEGIRANYSPRCRHLFAMLLQEAYLTGLCTSELMLDSLGRKMIPASMPALLRDARELGADQATLDKIAAMGREPVTTATADKLADVTIPLFSKLLADIHKTDQWHR